MTYLELKSIEKKATRLFNSAARAWVRGNNSGDDKIMHSCNKRCDKLRSQAQIMLEVLGITCKFPGLYPIFLVNGFTFYDSESAINEATKETILQ